MPSDVSRAVGLATRGSILRSGSQLGNMGLATDPGVPALALDFSRPLPSSITFARADATPCATYFGSDGVLKVSPVNLFIQSQDFSNVQWGKTGLVAFGSGSVADSIAAPDGTLTADYVLSDALTSNHTLSYTGVALQNGTCTISIYAKAGSHSKLTIQSKKADNVTYPYSRFDLSAGTVASDAAGSTGRISNVGGGWYRCSITYDAGAGAATPIAWFFLPSDTWQQSYAGTSTGLYVWGAQFEASATAASYIPTTSAINSVPRIDYDPATGVCKGLLIEESRANLIPSSRDGSTGWTTATDVTTTKNQVGIDGVVNSATLCTEGTLLTAVLIQQNMVITAGATLTASIYFKYGNVQWVRVLLSDNTSSVGANAWFDIQNGAKGSTSALGTATAITSDIQSIGNGWYRCIVTVTLTGSALTNASLRFHSAAANGSTTRVSGATYRFDVAQVEAGAFVTSPIITTTTALTRQADSASIVSPNFTPWWNATEGTFVARIDRIGFDGTAGSVGIVQADDNTTNNRVALRIGSRLATGRAQGTVSNATVLITNTGVSGGSDWVVNTPRSLAFGYMVGTGGVTEQGLAPAAVSLASLPSACNQLQIGGATGAGALTLNGHIRTLTYYNKRLSDATLKAMTL